MCKVISMCGRFDLDLSNKDIDNLVKQLKPDHPPLKQGEIFPTNTALTLIMRDGAPVPEAMAWGFPRWDGKGVVFNARAESALEKPFFRKALLQYPAVIPVNGFYEWRKNLENGTKDKFRFFNPDAGLLYLAGFWNIFPQEELPHHFTILTTAANASMLPYHSRMPVLLGTEELHPWLNGENRSEILTRQPRPVSAQQMP